MMSEVERLGPADALEVVDVFCDAFADYPVMRYVLDGDPGLEELVTLFVMARAYRREPLLGVRGDEGLQAAAILSDPRDPSNPPELEALRERTWASLGPAARARYETFGAAAGPFVPEVPHLHLNMIGVRRASQGRGLAGRLLDAVHTRSELDPTSEGVSLSTEVEENVALYERFGYEVVGSAPVETAFTTWAMYRPNGAAGRHA